MDIKSIIQLLFDPKILAAAGGYAAYHFWGRKQQGYKPWAYTGGGMVAGYLIGKAVQGFLQPGQVPPPTQQLPAQGPPQASASGLTAEEKADLARMAQQQSMVDLDSPARLPPPEPEPQRVAPAFVMSPTGTRTPSGDVVVETGSSIAKEDVSLLEGVGSYGDSLGGNGLGSYSGNDHDKEVDELMQEIAKSSKRRIHKPNAN